MLCGNLAEQGCLDYIAWGPAKWLNERTDLKEVKKKIKVTPTQRSHCSTQVDVFWGIRSHDLGFEYNSGNNFGLTASNIFTTAHPPFQPCFLLCKLPSPILKKFCLNSLRVWPFLSLSLCSFVLILDITSNSLVKSCFCSLQNFIFFNEALPPLPSDK